MTLPNIPPPPAWTKDANCAREGINPDDWFTEGTDDWAYAVRETCIRICNECPVKAECLEWALRTEPVSRDFKFGIWGGVTPNGRARLQRARRRAA